MKQTEMQDSSFEYVKSPSLFDPSKNYVIEIYDDQDRGQKGWKLGSHRYFDKDKKSNDSTYAIVTKIDEHKNFWKIVPTEQGEYNIQLSTYQYRHGFLQGQSGWQLGMSETVRDDLSNYSITDGDLYNMYQWKIIPQEEEGTYIIGYSNSFIKSQRDQNSDRQLYLAAHRYFPKDKREGHTTYIIGHSDFKKKAIWKIYEDNSEDLQKQLQQQKEQQIQQQQQYSENLFDPRKNYVIEIHDDQDRGQKGWKLGSHRFFGKDKKDERSTYAIITKIADHKNLWNIVPSQNGEYSIQLSEKQNNHAFLNGQWNWKLGVSENVRDGASNYALTSGECSTIYSWKIIPQQEQGTFIIQYSNGFINGERDQNSDRQLYLAAHRSNQRDQREGHTTYIIGHSDFQKKAVWKIYEEGQENQYQQQIYQQPTQNFQYQKNNLFDPSKHYVIEVFDDENRGQKGWKLGSHRYFDKDKKSHDSTYAIVTKIQEHKNIWKIVPSQPGEYIIQLSGFQHNHGFLKGQDDWRLGVSETVRDGMSNYVVTTSNPNIVYSWKIIPQNLEQGTFVIQYSNGYVNGYRDPNSNRELYLAAHRSNPRDQREGHTTYIIGHQDQQKKAIWRIKEFNTQAQLFDPSKNYVIEIHYDENRGQKGWKLGSHRYFDSDKKSQQSTYAIVTQINTHKNFWKIIPQDNGEYVIQVSDFQYNMGFLNGQNNWKLGISDTERDGASNYAVTTGDKNTMYTWKIIPQQQKGTYTLEYANGLINGQKDQNSDRNLYLAAHRSNPRDQREGHTTYIIGHQDFQKKAVWKIYEYN